ncbi:hypothetical protein O181_072793 [Austropuccinia psidii MF-1]|uniref:Zinc finger PHD-type domain-containing protein n=1 Tax=Austropuccinia psidii MF-1 TaxID=1389203 RepID=A0A9Q3I9G9_9BASI|nr:hypothetical protein [Austropuccinia psidii MF-1]
MNHHHQQQIEDNESSSQDQDSSENSNQNPRLRSRTSANNLNPTSSLNSSNQSITTPSCSSTKSKTSRNLNNNNLNSIGSNNHNLIIKKNNKSALRRSSLNVTKKEKKKRESHSPPIIQPEPDLTIDDETNLTRCVCGEDNDEANDVIMFQCDKCSVWQHGPCVGLYVEFPGEYFCDKCRPDLHTTGHYRKSSPPQRSKRSPSFTSSSSRRERVNTDAASLAAFLTDAGVKPEDQLSLGGFALPTFAQTRRQSNMLVDGAVPSNKKHNNGGESSPNLHGPSSVDNDSTNHLPELSKSKRKRLSIEPLDLNISHDQDGLPDEKPKRSRVNSANELPSPATSASGFTAKQIGNSNHSLSGHGAKHKRNKKIDQVDEFAISTSKSKTAIFGGKSANNHHLSNPSHGRRGSPAKRLREDSRRSKNTIDHDFMPLEGWGLPDHLSYLDYLLPTSTPQPILVEDGKYEAPTKVKFPGKRTTIADLRKRSKHLVDYLQKVQIETSEREKRNELISKSLNINENSYETKNVDTIIDQIKSPISLKTLEIMDDLTRELYHWQEKFKQN